MNKATISKEQLDALLELIDEDCMGKTPFVCSDGESSDRFMTRLFNTITDFFIVEISTPD